MREANAVLPRDYRIEGPVPSLSLAERDRRWRRVRGLMAQRGLAALRIAGLESGEQPHQYVTNRLTTPMQRAG